MQDPVKTIKDLLNSNWIDDASALDKDNITWRFGQPENPATRFQDMEYSFEFAGLTEVRRKRSLSRSLARKIVTVDCWMKLRPDSDEETFSGYKQTISDQIDTIITANETSATDLNLIYVSGGGRDLDNKSENYLRIIFEIVCVFEV